MKNKRWYDFDSTVSLAINSLETVSDKIKSECSIYIIKRAKDMGIKNENDINSNFNFVWQRKSDSSLDFQNALQYMKKMDPLIQKEVALEILRKIKNNI